MELSVQECHFDQGLELNQFIENAQGAGAVASFVGLVRDYRQQPDGTKTVLHAMKLQHYPGMTERVLQDLINKAKMRFSLQKVRLIHRYGLLQPNAPIVMVITASPHRADAFDGCTYLMDCLKTDAPFWKCEFDHDGNEQWVETKKNDSDRSNQWQKK